MMEGRRGACPQREDLPAHRPDGDSPGGRNAVQVARSASHGVHYRRCFPDAFCCIHPGDTVAVQQDLPRGNAFTDHAAALKDRSREGRNDVPVFDLVVVRVAQRHADSARQIRLEAPRLAYGEPLYGHSVAAMPFIPRLQPCLSPVAQCR